MIQSKTSRSRYLSARAATTIVLTSLLVPASCANGSRQETYSSEQAPISDDAAGSGNQVVSSSAADVAAVASNEDAQAVQVLFDLAPYGDDGNQVLNRLVEESIADCMRQAGFEYTMVPFVPRGEAWDALGLVPPLPEDDVVARQGYASLTPPLPEVAPDAEQAAAQNESRASDPAWDRAYAGDDSTGEIGCSRSAFETIYDQLQLRAEDLYMAIAPSIAAAMGSTAVYENSPDLQTATAAWRDCMNGRGFDYESPNDAVGSFVAAEPGAAPSADEVRTATNDFACRAETGYQTTLLVAYGDMARSWLAQNEGQVVELTEATRSDIEALKRLSR